MVVLKVFLRCIAVEFYKQNAAFFGLIFLVFFGFIKSSEHIAIGSFLVANPSTLFFLYIIWIGYVLKLILFVLPTLNHEKNQFFEAFFLLGSWTKIKLVSAVSILLSAPILLYAAFLMALALRNAFFLSMISIFLSAALLLVCISYFLITKLKGLPHEKTFFQLRFLNKIAKPPSLFFIEHLIRNDLALILLTKIYTGLMIIGASALYRTDQFDIRLLSTGILLALVGNVAILHKYIWFCFYKMSIVQNLPVSFVRNIFIHFFTFFLLIIPEVVFIIRYYPLPPTLLDMTGIIAFGFSIMSLIYGLLLLKQIELSDFIIKIFWLIVFTTFLILFSIHPSILAIVYLLISMLIAYFRMYKFEFVEKAH